MVTRPNTTISGAAFTNAPNDSAFGKVFLNNMDRNSFSWDTKKQIALVISNNKTAMFDIHSTISETQEYRNCQVSKKLIHFLYCLHDLSNLTLD